MKLKLLIIALISSGGVLLSSSSFADDSYAAVITSCISNAQSCSTPVYVKFIYNGTTPPQQVNGTLATQMSGNQTFYTSTYNQPFLAGPLFWYSGGFPNIPWMQYLNGQTSNYTPLATYVDIWLNYQTSSGTSGLFQCPRYWGPPQTLGNYKACFMITINDAGNGAYNFTCPSAPIFTTSGSPCP